ncbi:MAG: protein kinase, partial [Thermoanaerobaculia bacterium]
MGEVYKARDTRLDRAVAIKVLPSHLSDSAEFKQRFEREAKAISQLSHAHICALYDVGNADGVEYLVMELLEGQSLADRLAKGPLPTDQLLKAGIEIADALDKAHKHGIVHRDLKPGNIMMTKSGVKLLDFGLARLHPAQAASTSGVSILATEVSAGAPLTERGTILGTFQYMSPEQLEGRNADPRSDIFAFGCVLYEMATGRKAFSGKSQASLIASILEHDPPPISSVQPLVPPALDRVVRTCLAKDPDDRWQTAHDLTSELKWIAEAGSQTGAPATVRARRRHALTAGWGTAAGMALLAAVLGVLLVSATSRARSQTERVFRTHFLPPKGERLLLDPLRGRGFAISPDGARLVYVVGKGVTSELRLRSLDSRESSVIPGTDGANFPFFSPDGKWVGFNAGPKLKKVALAGGSPVTLSDAPQFRGAAWGEDGSIYFVPNV